MSASVLLVDDDPEVVSLFAYALRRAGYQVETALNGETGLEQARRVRPDVIVLDIMMPDLNGYEVARRLRALPETAAIPLVILSVRAVVGDQVKGLQAGAVAYLVKPILPLALIRTVREVLSRPVASSTA